MRCSNVRRHIDLASRIENDQAMAELRPHLDSCPRCKDYHEQALKLQRLLSPAPLPEFPTWMHEKIMDQARTHEPQRARLRRQGRLQLIPATAAILLSLYFGSLVGIKAYETGSNVGSAELAVASEDSRDYAIFGESSIFELAASNGGTDE